MGKLKIQIIELFKGKKVSYVLEYYKGTSCDIGISKGEEWILFAQINDGEMSIFPCDLNQLYKAENGMRDWKYETGFYELNQLKKLYKHPIINHKDGLHEEWYANGQKEIEETYLDGIRNGVRKIWFPNGVLYCQQTFIRDTLTGKSEWFYSSGQLKVEEIYVMGEHCNMYRTYFDTTVNERSILESIDKLNVPNESMKSKPKKIQVQYEIVFNSSGRAILSKEYGRSGKLLKEETIIPEQNFSTFIHYYENGSVYSIRYQLNRINYGHYQEYDLQGFPKRSWDYDENGTVIKNE
jgi:antitoxin component YwqK of YwqJK toxin-antitoxin module